MSYDEETGEETFARVILVHIGGCQEYVRRLANNLEKMHCKVEQFCLIGNCSTASELLFSSKPNEGDVLLVFIMCYLRHRSYSHIKHWQDDFLDLLKIRPNLRRVIISPDPPFRDNKSSKSAVIAGENPKMVKCRYWLERLCAENASNSRILYPDSLPINEDNWTYDMDNMPDHVIEKLAQMISDLATNPKAKFENHVESGHTDEVRTNIC